MSLQAQQIVALACQTAGVTGYTSQAGVLLNSILQELAQTYDFDIARGTIVITLNGTFGPYNLPADYLRADENDVFYTINGVPYFPVPQDLSEFDALIQQAGIQGYPVAFATDMSQSPPTMMFWPAPSGNYPVTVRYRRQMADIATPEASATVPWFPNTTYLLRRLTGEILLLADDDRAAAFLGDSPMGAQGILNRYLKLKDDNSNRVKTVGMDRRRFGRGGKDLPNTKLLGW